MPTVSVTVAESTSFFDIQSQTSYQNVVSIVESTGFFDIQSTTTGHLSRYVNPYPQYKDYNGVPYAGGLLYSYATATDIPQATYADFFKTVTNPNPITLDARGSPGSMFLIDGAGYKFILTDADGDQIWMREYTYSFVTKAPSPPVPPPPPPPPPPGPTPCQIANVLDGLSITPTSAFSSRKLRSAYAGSSMRVWRASDHTEMDIGFDTNCSLDSTALLAFCAGTNCVIAKWYDQSGNGNDLGAAAGDSNGPVIVSGGSLVATINGHPASTTGSTFLNNNVGNLVGTTQGTIFAVANATSATATSSVASWWQLDSLLGMASSDNNGLAINFGFGQTGTPFNPPSFIPTRYVGNWLSSSVDMNTPVTYTFGTSQVFAFRYNTGDLTITKGYIGGGTPSTDAHNTANAGPIAFNVGFGGNNGATNQFQGKIAEVITFNQELSLTDANFLGSNQNTYWAVPWTTISV